MTRNRLWKTMLVSTVLFTVVSMAGMLYYAAAETVVIAEEAPDRTDYGESEEDMRSEALRFQGSEEEGLRIPLPPEIRADDIAVENRYSERCICVTLYGEYGEFYRTHFVEGDCLKIEEGFCLVGEGKTRLSLRLRDVYENEYTFESGALGLVFSRPRELYEKIVVLDPAHGGSDEGNAANGVTEKDVALEITEKVREKLEDSGIRVYCTRTDDTGLTAQERAEFVNAIEADMLIGVRVGADQNSGRTCGISAFYNGTYFIPYFGNIELADLLERGVVTAAEGKANGLFEAEKGDGLLEGVRVPAAAVEVGYATNEKEASLLVTEEYRERLAEGIADAVIKAFADREQRG